MFVRVKRSGRNGKEHEYLQIVRSFGDGGRVRQQVLGTLGRRDELVASGEINQLLTSLGRFSNNLRVVEAVRKDHLRAREARLWGPPLVFGRLWEAQGLPDLLHDLARERKSGFDVERTSFALALQRLCRPGSDLEGSRWLRTVEAQGFQDLQLHHLYRTTSFLFEVRETLERELFFKDRDLFSKSLHLVFIDKLEIDIPVIGNIIERLLQALAAHYVKPWMKNVVAVLNDIVSVLQHVEADGELRILQTPTTPVLGSTLTAEERWTQAYVRLRSACYASEEYWETHPECGRQAVVLAQAQAVYLGYSDDKLEVGVAKEAAALTA